MQRDFQKQFAEKEHPAAKTALSLYMDAVVSPSFVLRCARPARPLLLLRRLPSALHSLA